jgi:ABC-type multidrug transport system fused ATPase/permease subunit
MALIERFYDPQEGAISYDGTNVKEVDPQWYKKQVAIVSQEPVLFSGTVRENVAYGLSAEEFTEEDFIRSLKMANAYKFVCDKKKFPEGFETIVGEKGVRLSGGQKQRIAIARALIRKPKVLLLDEATSALDAESESKVQKSLEKLIASGDQTVVMIAHRLSTVKNANKIFVLDDGVVAETGTHKELVAMNGVYKKLVDKQLVKVKVNEKGEEIAE